MPHMKFQAPAQAPEVRREMVASGASEIDTQIATAKRYPRDVKASLAKARQLATMSEEVAEECHYSLPRAGKQIEGPSVRLAEIVASCWGNLRYGSRVVAVEEKEVVVEGAAFDLENNVAVSKQARRRITRKDGSRFDDDMIQVTSNAASSIAVRNAIFQIIPKPFWQEVVDATSQVIHQGKKPIGQRVEAALKWFAARGAEEVAVLSLLGKKNRGEITIEEIRELLGIRNAITEGTSSIAEIFGIGAEAAPGVKKSLNLKKPTQQRGEGSAGPAQAGEYRITPPASEPDPFDSSQPAEVVNQFHDSPPPASSETGPEGGMVLPGEEVPPPIQRTAKEEVRHLGLEIGGDVKKARAILRQVSGGKWDSPNHPDCTEEECQRVLDELRAMWLETRGKQIGREPGSDG